MSSKTAVLIVGMHRSGTSALTKGVEVLGFPVGTRLIAAGVGNEKGFWEDVDVVDLNSAILGEFQQQWDNIKSSDWENLSDGVWEGYVDQATLLLKEKFGEKEQFAIKDPRISLLIPFWARVLESLEIETKLILSLRNPLNVAASLEKRDGIRKEKTWLLWLLYTYAVLCAAKKHPVYLVDYDELLDKPQTVISGVADYLDNKPSDQTALRQYCDAFLEHRLRHTADAHEVLWEDAAVPIVIKKLDRWLSENKNRDINKDLFAIEAVIDLVKKELREFDWLMNEIHALNCEKYYGFREVLEIEFQQRMEGKIEEIRKEYDACIADIKKSLSWKVTGPLRGLAEWFRSVFGR